MLALAVIIADLPTLSIFLKLNSSPRPKSRKITPISAHKLRFSRSLTVGSKSKYGPAKMPASTYPSTIGCFSFLQISVVMPA